MVDTSNNTERDWNILKGMVDALGIDCRVQVEVRTEDGLPLPYGASLDVERDQVLSDYMAQELGIPVSRQSWQPEE